MSIVSTGSFAKDLWPGVNAWYGMKYSEYPVEHLEIFDRQTSNLAFEEEVGMTGFSLAPIKPEGTAITFEGTEQGFIDRYTHITYGLNDLGLCEVIRKANPLNFGEPLISGQSEAKPDKTGTFNDYLEREYFQAEGSGGQPINRLMI